MAAQVASIVQSIPSDVAAPTFQAITQSLGNYSPQFIEELRAQGLRPEYVQAMYVSNPAVQKELVDISAMEVPNILEGLPNTTKNDVISEMNDVLSDYRQAYLAGGGNVANNIFNQQINTAQKLAFTRLKNGSADSPAQAVETAINDLIPEYQQAVIERNGVYVVPMNFDAQTVRYNVSLLMSESALGQLNIKPLESDLVPDFVDEAVALASLSSTGKFLNNSTGDGLSLHYDINGVEEAAGFEVKFSELPALVKSLYSADAMSAEEAGFRREGLIQAGMAPEEAVVIDEANPYAAEIQRLVEENK